MYSPSALKTYDLLYRRFDAKGKPTCVKGKLCKGRCIPKGHTCHEVVEPKGVHVAAENFQQSIAATWQNLLDKTGVRAFIPGIQQKVEDFLHGGTADREFGGNMVKSLASAQADTSKPPAGQVSGKERTKYVNQILSADHRVREYKYAAEQVKGKPPGYPSAEEVAALRHYTSTIGYKEINMTLRGQDAALEEWRGKQSWWNDKRSSAQVKKEALADVKMTRSALNKLPKYEGYAYRGGFFPDEMIDQLKVGKVFKDKGFTSTTRNRNTAYPGNYAMRIKSKTGRDITAHEKFSNDEILFQPSTRFKVLSKRAVSRSGRKTWLLEMEEI